MKGELIPTMMYAEGRPRDAGTDRALANALNQFYDNKSRHSSPWLYNAGYKGQDTTLRIRPIFFGTDHPSQTVERFVTIAPFFRSSTGGTASLKISLSEMFPMDPPGIASYTPRFPGKYAIATWSTTSTTWTTGADAVLSLGVKDLMFGFAFLIIEALGLGNCCEVRGLAKCAEGIRVVS